MNRQRVVVIGAGFGGLAVARSIDHPDVDVTIVDANNYHTFQPLLYQVATSGLSPDDVARPVRGIFRTSRWRRGPSRVDVTMGRVTDVDVDAHSLSLADGRSLDYDTLVIAAGAVSSDFGVEGVDAYTFPLKSLDDAVALRTHLIANFERAASTTGSMSDGPLPDGALDVVICGGGPTGVEMAGGISELYRKVLARDFPELPVERAGITLVEMADRVLTPFSDASSRNAAATSRSMGVELRLGVGIERVDGDVIDLTDGTALRAATCVWAAGVKAHPISSALGIELAQGGRIPVSADLSVIGCDDVFAIGDIAAVLDDDGSPLPQVAQPAIQGGHHVAEQIERRLRDEPTRPFRYVDKGSMATIGRHSAVAELANGWRLSGVAGWVSWLGLHLVYLMGFRNRLNVFVNWCWNYLTFDRASRLLGEHDLHDD